MVRSSSAALAAFVSLVLLAPVQAQSSITLSGAASPATAQPGGSVSVTGSGFPTGTIDPAAVTVTLAPASLGAGSTVTTAASAVTTVVGSTRRVTFTVPVSLSFGAATLYQVSVRGSTSTAVTFVSGNVAALTINPAAQLLTLTPNSGSPGKTISVSIVAQFSNFVAGSTQASFGASTSVNGGPTGGFGTVSVISATQAIATVAIDSTAAPGPRTPSVKTGQEQISLGAGFTVTASGPPPVNVTLTSAAASGTPGTSVTLAGDGFPVGLISPGSITITLQPVTAGTGTVLSTFADIITPASGASRQVAFRIPSNVVVQSATAYQATLAGLAGDGTPFSSLNAVTVTFLPVALQILSLTPNSGNVGQALSVSIKAAGTHFVQGTTEASFGAGISVGGGPAGGFGPVTVSGPTTAAAQVTIAAGSAPGVRTVTLRTGSEQIAFTAGFIVTSTPTQVTLSSSTSPSSGIVGRSLTFVGSNFPSGTIAATQVTITLSPATAGVGPTATTQPSIITSTTTGGWQFAFTIPSTLTTSQPLAYQVSLAGSTSASNSFVSGNTAAFTLNPAPSMSLDTIGLPPGQSATVAIVGRFTNFVQGITQASFGADIAVGGAAPGTLGPVTVTGATSATASVSVIGTATKGPRTVRVVTGLETALLIDGFAVLAASPAVISTVSPKSANPGQTLSVVITGSATHFVQGSTLASFGAGISVGGAAAGATGPVAVTSATSAVAQIVVGSGVPAGPRSVTISTGTEQATLAAGFSVGAPAPITLISPATPSATTVGATVTVTGNNLPAGTVAASQVGVTLSPVTAGAGLTTTLQPASVTSVGPGTLQFAFVVPALLAPNQPVPYLISVAGTTSTGSGFSSANQAQLTINALPVISIDPADRTPGQTASISITGTYTNFVQGTTQASFGDGVSVGGAPAGSLGPITVTSPTAAVAQININPLTPVGSRTVTVVTGTEAATLPGGFHVLAGNPALFSIEPSAGAPGQTITATITGQFTHFTQGTTQVTVGNGIVASNISVKSATSLTVQLTIAANAVAGGRIVDVKTGTELAELLSGFTVGSTTPAITYVQPPTLQQGQTALVLVNVQAINFVVDTTQASLGAGVSIGGAASGAFGPVSVINGRTALLVTSVDPAAAPGPRTLQIKIGQSNVSLPAAFTVTAKATAPLITITSPPPLSVLAAATVTVSGTVDDPKSTVTVNGGIQATVTGLTFSASVPLSEGINLLTATATNSAGIVGNSSISITRDNTPPVVRIQVPSDGAVLTSSTVMIAGLINDIVHGTVTNAEANVTVNGIRAEVSNRTFGIPQLLLVRGKNVITAVGIDLAGNQSTHQITVMVVDSAAQQNLQIVSGNDQSAQINQPLANPLVVVALDANGNPVPNLSVTFAVQRSEGVLLPNTGPPARQATVKTDNNGLAQMRFQVGGRVGGGNSQISVSAPGFSGEVMFCATTTTGPAALFTQVMGDGQRGIVGQPLAKPLVAILYDAGSNPVAGVPILFKVREGGGTFENGVNVITALTDTNGEVSVTFTLGPNLGPNTNVVNGSFKENDWQNMVTFFASSVLPTPQPTTVSGLVLDNSKRPIAGATAKIVGTPLSAVSDQAGHFTIQGAPVGTIMLIVDGSTSPRPEKFPFLAFQMVTIGGQDNMPGLGPVELPPLDSTSAKIVGGNQDQVLTMKGLPGYQFTVFANSATFPDGSKQGLLSLSQVAADKVPMPPPNGSAPRVFGTLQPANVKFNPPIKVQFPNTEGLAPGTVIELTSFDHDLEQFVTVGTAHVSQDGRVITSDPGFGIPKSGWHGPLAPPPPHNCPSNCSCMDGVCQ